MASARARRVRVLPFLLLFAWVTLSCARLHPAPPDVFDPFGEAALFEGDERYDPRLRLGDLGPPQSDTEGAALADRAASVGLCTRAAALNSSSKSLSESIRQRNRRALAVLLRERPGLVDSARTRLRELILPPLLREGLLTPAEAERLRMPLNLLVSPVGLATGGDASFPPFKPLAGQLLLMAEAETLLVHRRCGPRDPALDSLVARWKGLPTFEQRFQVSIALGQLPTPRRGDTELARRAKQAVARAQFRRALEDARVRAD